MTEYERGLRDAAKICREQARTCVPFRVPVFQLGFLPRISEKVFITKEAMARMAVRCARAIENAASR